MRPGDVARLVARIGIGRGVAVALGGPRVGELELAVADDFLRRGGTFHVVEIAEDDDSCVRVRLEMFVHDAAQDFRLLQTEFRLVGIGHGPARFQMRGNEGEGEIFIRLNFHFGKTPADAETTSVEQEAVVGMRMAGDKGKFAQHGDMDVGVKTLDVFPEREVAAVGLERGAEFEQGVGGAHFLQREHVGIQRAEALADFGPGLVGLDEAAGFGGLVQIIFDVVGGDAKRAGERIQSGQRQDINGEATEHGGRLNLNSKVEITKYTKYTKQILF